MARLDKVASTYAKAVFDAVHKGSDRSVIQRVIDELSVFSQIVNGHNELRHVLATSVFCKAARAMVIEDLFAKLKLSDETKRVALVLSAMKRLGQVAGISEKLKLLLLDSLNTVSLQIETSFALEALEKEKVETSFQKILGKEIEASYVVDASLIGGLRVTAAGKTYDGSLSGWLNAFEEKLVGGNS